MNNLVKKLEKYRLVNRVSQERLAEKLKVSFTTVNRWLNGKTEPNMIQSYHIKKLIEKRGNK